MFFNSKIVARIQKPEIEKNAAEGQRQSGVKDDVKVAHGRKEHWAVDEDKAKNAIIADQMSDEEKLFDNLQEAEERQKWHVDQFASAYIHRAPAIDAAEKHCAFVEILVYHPHAIIVRIIEEQKELFHIVIQTGV